MPSVCYRGIVGSRGTRQARPCSCSSGRHRGSAFRSRPYEQRPRSPWRTTVRRPSGGGLPRCGGHTRGGGARGLATAVSGRGAARRAVPRGLPHRSSSPDPLDAIATHPESRFRVRMELHPGILLWRSSRGEPDSPGGPGMPRSVNNLSGCRRQAGSVRRAGPVATSSGHDGPIPCRPCFPPRRDHAPMPGRCP